MYDIVCVNKLPSNSAASTPHSFQTNRTLLIDDGYDDQCMRCSTLGTRTMHIKSPWACCEVNELWAEFLTWFGRYFPPAQVQFGHS